ncbi:hypothetical protein C7974DRAFT_28077 [Boeremia exigua]|uniref:uncharacterized protein n=1 Tax=Boeremia exigua TaxID=749465 RepID=UPI001E8CA0D6|nr:uncharacterized protein C7974DRAFT_28077 [Boeremia exigua]KAH6644796.1 hypothetical protein C7974DRAFT_28077 [Boeremia exigua]
MTYPAPTQLATSDLFKLNEHTILVTGGAGAVGTVVGKTILESGGDVVFLDLMPQMPEDKWLDVLASAAIGKTEVRYHQLDVQNEDNITAVMDHIRTDSRHPIRGLVTCAAISGESDAGAYPEAIFRRILDVNTTGTFLVARAAANEMHRANVTGSIVLIASISGHGSNRGINSAAYNISKSAVHQMARSLAAEWGHPQNTFPGSTVTATNQNPSTEPRREYPPIRVNTLSPGHIDTPLSEGARLRGLTDAWAGQNMLGRISQPEEFRAPVLFLLSEGSSYMTGADLRVDGGHCAW